MQQLVLIDALIRSHQPDNLKKVIANKLIKQVVENQLDKNDCKNVCQQLTEWILTSDKSYLKESSLEGFNILAQNNKEMFQEICDSTYITDLFTNSKYTSRVSLIGLIVTILVNFRHLPQTNRPKLMLLRDLRSHLVSYLRQHGTVLATSVAVAHLYTTLTETLPETPLEISALCGVIVTLLGSYVVPSKPEQITAFRRDTDKLCSVLPLLWAKSRNQQACLETLNSVYVLISDTGDGDPCMCLSAVIEKVPQASIVQASQTILSQSESEVGEAKLVRALSRLVSWLGMWPSKQLHTFILDIFVRVAKERSTVLKAVAEANLTATAKKLPIPVFRSQLEPIFFFLLYGHQNSQSMFVKLAGDLPTILSRLHTEGVTARLTWEKLAEAGRYLHGLHHTVPASLTQDMLAAVENSHPLTEGRKAQLGSQAWGSGWGGGRMSGWEGGSSDSMMLHSGKVGLINLGNTCYMNSVIQALFNTTRFRSLVFASSPGYNQPVLASLQQVFIFLRHSKRNIYSPSEFLRIARPPWFESGRQQDCSEFLTYLLDTLQEEERAVRSVESSSAPVSDIAMESLAEISEVLEDQDEDMKSSSSATAIETIQEELKNSIDRKESATGENNEEEEIDEARDIVEDTGGLGGSSGSLTDDKRKKGSQGSLSMSRWSTEENLSIGDSREVLNMVGSKESLNGSKEILNTSGSTSDIKEENLEVNTNTFQDAYSNGTDSGIQSVGSSVSAHCPEETDTTTPLSVVQKMFGGRMETCFTCQTCNNKSMFSDWFTDLHLAIPQTTIKSHPTVQAADEKILAQKETLKRAFDDFNSTSPSQSQDTSTSQHEETDMPKVESKPTDPQTPSITITPPQQQPQPTSNPKQLGVSDLISHYLAPETLDGDNQYQCDNCNMLRDAVKTTRLSAAPEYLNITLLRFKYDRSTNRRAKVFTTIDYPQELNLPVKGGDVTYQLYSVVVHSGYSSDGGHYYTWAKPDSQATTWLVLNDSQVTEASWAQFKQQTSRLSRDTAYLLFYQRVGVEEEEEVVPSKNVMDRVISDNMKYARERESGGVRFQGGNIGGSRRKDDDGDGGSGSGCNENFGQFGGARCVF